VHSVSSVLTMPLPWSRRPQFSGRNRAISLSRYGGRDGAWPERRTIDPICVMRTIAIRKAAEKLHLWGAVGAVRDFLERLPIENCNRTPVRLDEPFPFQKLQGDCNA
jgi:hypothetical protein